MLLSWVNKKILFLLWAENFGWAYQKQRESKSLVPEISFAIFI